MIIWLSLLVAVVGVLMYALCVNPKLQRIGEIGFFAGLLAFLLRSEKVIELIGK
jgi:Na+/phosphate symporter